MKAKVNFAFHVLASVILSGVLSLPNTGFADHIPDNLSQDLDPNFIACLMAVDDAKVEFRDTLQSACIQRMGDLCDGNGFVPAAQVIDCIHFETQRGIEFLQVATYELPKSIAREGFFGHRYEKRRQSLFDDTEFLRNSPNPQNMEAAIQQFVTIFSAVTTLFWLARETQTPLEANVAASFGDH